MGKGDKQNRKGTSASSARAAELLQSAGQGIQFLNLGNDLSSLQFPTGDDAAASDEFGDVDPEFRVAFRKLTKREPNTREKGLKTLAELVQNVTASSPTTVNGIRHFVRFYNYLIFDSVANVRAEANNTLTVMVLKLRKEIADQIVKMLPSALLSLYDPHAAVRKSAAEFLEKCFDESQRAKIYERAVPRCVKLCLEIVEKKHSLVKKQKYEDVETLGQRVDRLIVQAFSAIGALNEHCSEELVRDVFTTMDAIFDSISKMGTQLLNSLLTCGLQLLKKGHAKIFMETNASLKLLTLLDSDQDDALCRNAFNAYLFMAEAVASGKVKTAFTKREFINDLVLRMVAKKEKHYGGLQETLLPLIIIEIKNAPKDNLPYDWISEIVNELLSGDIPDKIFSVWTLTFIDVVGWLYDVFLPANWDDNFVHIVNFSTMRFLHLTIDRACLLPADVQKSIRQPVGDFAIKRLLTTDERLRAFADEIGTAIVNELPRSSALVGSILTEIATKEKQQTPPILHTLTAHIIANTRTPEALFQQVLRSGAYKSNDQIDSKLLLEKLVDYLKASSLIDEYVECYKYLQEKGLCEEQKLSELIDLKSAADILRIMHVYGKDAIPLLGNDVVQLLRAYISLFTKTADGSKNPWNEHFIVWMESVKPDDAFSMVRELGKDMSLRLLVKLVLALDCSNLVLDPENRTHFAALTTEKLFAFSEYVDDDDCEELDRLLRDTNFDLSARVVEVYKKIEGGPESDLAKAASYGKYLRNLPYAINAFQLSADDFANLCDGLDSMFAEQILLNEPMLLSASLSEGLPFKCTDVDRLQLLLKMMRTSVFYMSTETQNPQMLLYICLFHSLSKVYTEDVFEDELYHQIPDFVQNWNAATKKWDMPKLCGRFVYSLIESGKQIPFTILYTLRQLKNEFSVETLVDALSISSLDRKQKLRAVAALTSKVPSELLDDDELLHFINSFERASERLKSDKAQQDVALILLSDLRTKIEGSDWDFVFGVSGKDPLKDALSCSVMRLCNQIVHIVPDIESEIRDYVLCGLITAAENFSTNFRSTGPVRLLTTLMLRFFLAYDATLTSTINSLKCSDADSQEHTGRLTKLEELRHEWREFFGSSLGSYLLGWFMWSTFDDDAYNFPAFFRTQLCKHIHHVDSNIGLFAGLHSPSPILFGQQGEKAEMGTSGLFDALVELLFSSRPEQQLTAVLILQRELIEFLSKAADLPLDESTAKMLEMCDADEEAAENQEAEGADSQRNNIEIKLYEFFAPLMNRLQADYAEWSDVNSLDPWLAVADLLLRVVQLLDSHAAGAFCSRLQYNDIMDTMLYRICSYMNFQQDADAVKKYARRHPDAVFTLSTGTPDSQSVEHISLENYSYWLYRRALEIVPVVVREWFAKVKDTRLREFTQKNFSPILIEHELSNVGVQKMVDFTMRARPNTREIFVCYKNDEISLELSLILPPDYPLTKASIEHDKRKVLDPTLMNKLHKNLFAFISHVNGSLIDGLLQWKRGVEKQMEGVEPCAICLLTVSSSNYRLPDMKCRHCHKKFHGPCILRWLRESAKPSCPLCRAEFS